METNNQGYQYFIEQKAVFDRQMQMLNAQHKRLLLLCNVLYGLVCLLVLVLAMSFFFSY